MLRSTTRKLPSTTKAVITRKQLITRIAQPATPATLDITLKRREKLISKSMDTSSIMLPDGGE